MLLQRSLIVLEVVCLAAIVLFIVVLPANRCAKFHVRKVDNKSNNGYENNGYERCVIHPIQYDQNEEYKKELKQFKKENEYDDHHVSVCHRLGWNHYAFWKNMYLILVPAICCALLIVYTICEMYHIDLFKGVVRTTTIIMFSLFTIVYTITMIHIEQKKVANEWIPQVYSADFNYGLSVGEKPFNSPIITAPTSWKYAIMMCILTALFKIGRILIQHFFDDKKFFIAEDWNTSDKSDRDKKESHKKVEKVEDEKEGGDGGDGDETQSTEGSGESSRQSNRSNRS